MANSSRTAVPDSYWGSTSPAAFDRWTSPWTPRWSWYSYWKRSHCRCRHCSRTDRTGRPSAWPAIRQSTAMRGRDYTRWWRPASDSWTALAGHNPAAAGRHRWGKSPRDPAATDSRADLRRCGWRPRTRHRSGWDAGRPARTRTGGRPGRDLERKEKNGFIIVKNFFAKFLTHTTTAKLSYQVSNLEVNQISPNPQTKKKPTAP